VAAAAWAAWISDPASPHVKEQGKGGFGRPFFMGEGRDGQISRISKIAFGAAQKDVSATSGRENHLILSADRPTLGALGH
jgi:hypothetical protein